jgi:hypothetical protein
VSDLVPKKKPAPMRGSERGNQTDQREHRATDSLRRRRLGAGHERSEKALKSVHDLKAFRATGIR